MFVGYKIVIVPPNAVEVLHELDVSSGLAHLTKVVMCARMMVEAREAPEYFNGG